MNIQEEQDLVHYGSNQKNKEKTFDSSNTHRSSNRSADKIDIKNLNTIDTNQKPNTEPECCIVRKNKRMTFIYS